MEAVNINTKTEYDHLYKVTRSGEIISTRNGVLKGKISKDGYRIMNLCIKGKSKHIAAHRLVAQAYIPNPENKPTVNHKDGVKLNNHVDNLEWNTWKENTVHAVETGLRVAVGGLKHYKVKPFNMYDKNGKFIRSFERLKEAVDYLGTVKRSAIGLALNGRNKTAGGYVWKYKHNE